MLNSVILGVSRDSIASHKKFIDKHTLPFILLSDTSETVCSLYEVLKEKNMYGKKVMGIERSTFIIDENGMVKKIFRKVKVDGHIDDVINSLK
jgi:peroxiredoxin Q/BCP